MQHQVFGFIILLKSNSLFHMMPLIVASKYTYHTHVVLLSHNYLNPSSDYWRLCW